MTNPLSYAWLNEYALVTNILMPLKEPDASRYASFMYPFRQIRECFDTDTVSGTA